MSVDRESDRDHCSRDDQPVPGRDRANGYDLLLTPLGGRVRGLIRLNVCGHCFPVGNYFRQESSRLFLKRKYFRIVDPDREAIARPSLWVDPADAERVPGWVCVDLKV